jgi:hypothetical protein
MDANLKRISLQMPWPEWGRSNPGAALQKAADAMSMDLPEGNGVAESSIAAPSPCQFPCATIKRGKIEVAHVRRRLAV